MECEGMEYAPLQAASTAALNAQPSFDASLSGHSERGCAAAPAGVSPASALLPACSQRPFGSQQLPVAALARPHCAPFSPRRWEMIRAHHLALPL